MNRLFFAIALVAVSCLSMSACATDSKKESNSESMSDCATAKPEAPERHGWEDPLYGDVESVVVTTYKLEEKFGEVVRGDIEDCEKYYFNKAGDVIEKAQYNSDGSLREKETRKYDASRNMIEEAGYNSDGSFKYIFKYDASGNKIEYAGDDPVGSSLFKSIPKYDSSGNKIEEAAYYPDGSLGYKSIYKYDASGNMIEWAHYSSGGSLIDKTVYKYDASGNMIEKSKYYGEALLPISQTIYEITYRK